MMIGNLIEKQFLLTGNLVLWFSIINDFNDLYLAVNLVNEKI